MLRRWLAAVVFCILALSEERSLRDNPSPEFIVFIQSCLNSAKQRDESRSTWLNDLKDSNIQYKFLVSNVDSRCQQTQFEMKESREDEIRIPETISIKTYAKFVETVLSEMDYNGSVLLLFETHIMHVSSFLRVFDLIKPNTDFHIGQLDLEGNRVFPNSPFLFHTSSFKTINSLDVSDDVNIVKRCMYSSFLIHENPYLNFYCNKEDEWFFFETSPALSIETVYSLGQVPGQLCKEMKIGNVVSSANLDVASIESSSATKRFFIIGILFVLMFCFYWLLRVYQRSSKQKTVGLKYSDPLSPIFSTQRNKFNSRVCYKDNKELWNSSKWGNLLLTGFERRFIGRL